MVSFIQPSFARGEISPSLYGRVDIAAYSIALRQARNCIVHPHGSISNRAGLEHVAPVFDHGFAPRLIPFQFKNTDQYMLEFGDFYMRPFRNGGSVLEAVKVIIGITAANPPVVSSLAHGYTSTDEVFIDDIVGMEELNGRRFLARNCTVNTFELVDQVDETNIDATGYTPYVSGGTSARVYSLATPYQVEDLFRLKYIQSADVMTLTHPTYGIRDLTRVAHDDWTLVTPTFAPSINPPTGLALVADTAGAVTYRYQVTAIDRETQEESLPGLNATSKVITAITQANPAVVMSVAHGFGNGDEVQLDAVVGMTQVNGQRFFAAGVTANTFQLEGINSTPYGVYVSGGTARTTFIKITNGAVIWKNTTTYTDQDGAERYAIYREDNGIFGLVGETEAATFQDDHKEADRSITPPKARNPFLIAGDFPAASSYYEQRQVFGGSDNRPDTTNYSQTGNRLNYSRSSPQQASDAIQATINSLQVNNIEFYVPLNDLLILTSGSEWRVNSGQDAGFQADTLRQKPQSTWGCSFLPPIIIGSTVIFAEPNRTRIRTLGYSFQIDGYTGSELTLLASHLFEQDIIKEWAWASAPDSIIHGIRTDGVATCLTFNQEQEVVAWTRWDTAGKFESVGTLRSGGDLVEDEVYFVVRRRLNGRNVRSIEKMHSRRFTDVRDAFFVDCGLTYDDPRAITAISLTNPVVITSEAHGFDNGDEVDLSDIEWEVTFDEMFNAIMPVQLNNFRHTVANVTADTYELVGVDGTAYDDYVDGGYARKAVSTIGGLFHLAGITNAVALTDGDVRSNLTISALGEVTFTRKVSRAHIGLRYIADIETLDIEGNQGVTQGKLKKVPEVTIRFEKSRGLRVGPNQYALTEIKQREDEAYDEPTQLLSGDKDITLEPDWNSNGRIFLRQADPLPMTILAIIPKHVDMEDPDDLSDH